MQCSAVIVVLPTGCLPQSRDVLVCAPTGSGKTLAFCLPLLAHLQQPANQGFRAVVISPTRELASQVHTGSPAPAPEPVFTGLDKRQTLCCVFVKHCRRFLSLFASDVPRAPAPVGGSGLQSSHHRQSLTGSQEIRPAVQQEIRSEIQVILYLNIKTSIKSVQVSTGSETLILTFNHTFYPHYYHVITVYYRIFQLSQEKLLFSCVSLQTSWSALPTGSSSC